MMFSLTYRPQFNLFFKHFWPEIARRIRIHWPYWHLSKIFAFESPSFPNSKTPGTQIAKLTVRPSYER